MQYTDNLDPFIYVVSSD